MYYYNETETVFIAGKHIPENMIDIASDSRKKVERALLIGIRAPEETDAEVYEHLDELADLVRNLDIVPLEPLVVNLHTVMPQYYVGLRQSPRNRPDRAGVRSGLPDLRHPADAVPAAQLGAAHQNLRDRPRGGDPRYFRGTRADP